MQYQWYINTPNQAKFLAMVYDDGHLFWTVQFSILSTAILISTACDEKKYT